MKFWRIIALFCIAAALFSGAGCAEQAAPTTQTTELVHAKWRGTETFAIIEDYANANGYDVSQWPESLLELLERNAETKEYVLSYPLKKDNSYTIDLSAQAQEDAVPILYQWDERWGYTEYNGNLMGLSGCGPTCLSMVCLYVLKDPTLTPVYLARFSEENGYCTTGQGSNWNLFSEGGPKLGVEVIEIPLDENRIIRNLEVDNVIVCSMGPGDFTTGGHYILMTGYEDGMIRIHDPNSPERTAQLWEYERIKDQIRNLWVCR